MTRTKRLTVLLVLLGASLLSAGASAKDAYSILYEFQGGELGTAPFAAVAFGQDGLLYGTTAGGGSKKCQCGTVFSLAPDGTETVLHSFSGIDIIYHQGSDGAEPEAPLVQDRKGNFYGTTYQGGADDCSYGCGSVFRISPAVKEKMLHGFQLATADGVFPSGPVVIDAQGNLFGTTMDGGKRGKGTVYKIARDGSETLLHIFTGHADGSVPSGALLLDADGTLYGTTVHGGGACNCGTVFKLAPDGTNTLLYAFTGGTDGISPLYGLVRDADGNMYGTTTDGGDGQGTVFKLTMGGVESVLHVFSGGTDGATPTAGVTLGKDGNLYGVTGKGGDPACNCGTIFKVAPDGAETVLHAFQGPDGANPQAGLVADKKGSLYGTTQTGGSCAASSTGCGVVFELKTKSKS
jgi:uncharacterized repeat protein (TIGR03803 family)